MPKSSPFTLSPRISVGEEKVELKTIIEARRKFAEDNGLEKHPR